MSEDADFPFHFVSDWYDYQKNFILGLDLTPYYEMPIYQDEAMLSEVVPYEKKSIIYESSHISLYANRVVAVCGENTEEFLFDEASSFAVLGKNKLNIYVGKRIFQIKGDCRFNALKYVNIFYRYMQIKKGDNNGKFLGL